MSDYHHLYPLVSAVSQTWPISPCLRADRQRLSRLSRPERRVFSSSFRQLRIGQSLTDSRAKQTIEPVHRVPFHVSVAQSKGELANVAVQMLRAGVVIDAVQATLKQRKDALDTIGCYIAPHIFTGAMVDAVMRIEQPANAIVKRAFVCVDCGADLHVAMCKANRIASGYVAVDFGLHLACPALPACNDRHLANATASKAETLAFVLRGLFSTDVAFVNFNDARQFGRIIATRFAQALQHEPSGFLRDADLRVKLDAGDTLARRNEQIHGIKPLIERHLGPLEYRAGADGENQQVRVAAIEASALWVRPDALCFAASGAGGAIRPPLPLEIDPCAFLVWKSLEKLQQADGGLAHLLAPQRVNRLLAGAVGGECDFGAIGTHHVFIAIFNVGFSFDSVSSGQRVELFLGDLLCHFLSPFVGATLRPDKKITIRLDLACQQKSSLIYISP